MTSIIEFSELDRYKEFLKTFGDFTKPLENGVVVKIAERVKYPWDVFKVLPMEFKRIKVDASFILKVRDMEEKRIIGGCSEYALISAAILRTMGYPTAIIESIHLDALYTDAPLYHKEPMNVWYPTPRWMHSMNLVFYKDRWYLFDPTQGIWTRNITRTIIKMGYFPVFAHRDYADLNVRNRKDKFEIIFKVFKKKVSTIYLEEDLLFPKYQLYLHEE